MTGKQNTGDLSALGADPSRRHWKHIGGSPSDDWSTRPAVSVARGASVPARAAKPSPARGRVHDHWRGSMQNLKINPMQSPTGRPQDGARENLKINPMQSPAGRPRKGARGNLKINPMQCLRLARLATNPAVAAADDNLRRQGIREIAEQPHAKAVAVFLWCSGRARLPRGSAWAAPQVPVDPRRRRASWNSKGLTLTLAATAGASGQCVHASAQTALASYAKLLIRCEVANLLTGIR
jgi:hypothetical protein